MKTSDVSSNRPVQQSKSEGSSKAGKGKTEKQFKEVLSGPSAKSAALKKKGYAPLEKKGYPPLEKKEVGRDAQTHLGTHKGAGHKRFDPQQTMEKDPHARVEAKLKKTEEDPTLQPVPGSMQNAPQGVHTEAKVGKVQNPGLNIDEIQSIVNKVHVGINEKGSPECRFEIQTKNLGTLDLKVSAEKDQIHIEFVTEDKNAENVLKENLKELQQMLADKGLNLAETKFTPRDQQESEKQQSSGDESDDAYPPLPPTGPKRSFSL